MEIRDELVQNDQELVKLKQNLSNVESRLPVHRRSLTEQGALITAF